MFIEYGLLFWEARSQLPIFISDVDIKAFVDNLINELSALSSQEKAVASQYGAVFSVAYNDELWFNATSYMYVVNTPQIPDTAEFLTWLFNGGNTALAYWWTYKDKSHWVKVRGE